MTIFTKRGGIIVFAGCIAISIAISVAGYATLSIIADSYLKPTLSNLATNGTTSVAEVDYRSFYPEEASGGNIGAIAGAWLGEILVRGALNELVSIDRSLIYYFLLLGSLLIFSVVSAFPFFIAGADAKSIRIERRLSKSKSFAGDYLYIEVRVRNLSLNQIPVIEVYDAFPEVFELVLGENTITTQLASKHAIAFGYIIQTPTRGEFLIGPTKVVLHDRQGFFSSEAVLAELSRLIVYSSNEDIEKLKKLGSRRKLGQLFGLHKISVKGGGTEFLGIREYHPGDSIKNFHWQSLAKSGGEKIMVREFETEQRIRLMLMLDSSASMGAGLPRNTKLEYSIRSAVLMAYLATEKGDSVGLCVYDWEVNKLLEPKSGRNTMPIILEELTRVQPKRQASILTAVNHLLPRLDRSNYITIISDLENPHEEILEAVRKLRALKHNIFIISPFGPWFETKITGLSSTDRLIGEAIQEQFISRRAELFKKLSAYNVSVISVGPDDILANVISGFNAIKARG